MKSFTQFLVELVSAKNITDPEIQKKMRDALNSSTGDGSGAKEFFDLYRQHARADGGSKKPAKGYTQKEYEHLPAKKLKVPGADHRKNWTYTPGVGYTEK